MCGFCGFVDTSLDNKDFILNSMMDRIAHRGPDSSGKYSDTTISMGFRRLSFLDLAAGAQPLYNEDGRYVLTYNGEIYNFQSIREKLIAAGHIFKTHTDSEVLIHGYEEYGTKLLDHLRGMFAFVLWDKETKTLFGARDFFGIKPFYYTLTDNNNFVYASEIKAILEHPAVKRELNEEALETYLTFQYSALPETFFKGIFKLPPAHYFLFKEGKLTITRYWEPTFNETEESLEHYVDAIDAQMKESIEAHKISDVEVGSFLSSGVDSSYVASCFNGDHTFTVGFANEQYNEISYAEELSKEINIPNNNKIITPEEYWRVLPKVQYYMDEPLADPAAVALYFVCELASKTVKGVLSGEGADEFFGGYNIYKEPLDSAAYRKLPKGLRKFLAQIALSLPFSFKGKNFLVRASKDLEERFVGNAYMFSEEERKRLLKVQTSAPNPFDLVKPIYDKVKHKEDVTKMQYLDMHMWLSGDILLKADKMSMANSLEVRVPFLDKKVFEVASRIPVKYKVNKENTKYAMRLAAKRNLPPAVANKKKLGFPVPIRVWLKEDKYYNVVKSAFNSPCANKYFHTESLIALLDEHRADKADNSRKIWTVFMFLVWYSEYFNDLNSLSA
ncbi:asparagine synthase (glutamine-hydrolyzing) [Sporanaerobium hydrogeniformans]|uniref:Asparagine synthase (Glutamine-hydrolyzing) n=1 Tax=Sporanaerobium hydrogeniformans TaxID=3072179 RepID=A0AC61DAY7_9FIRM|nr:asparagine synthase (glutamine-hydrolyzing) [Sporanaerobium hydrogeniformans]PHV70040.1 asparagine synthase (glutamine-hydrolyzing) [Sporanaerobium hydrogeniformans]